MVFTIDGLFINRCFPESVMQCYLYARILRNCWTTELLERTYYKTANYKWFIDYNLQMSKIILSTPKKTLTQPLRYHFKAFLPHLSLFLLRISVYSLLSVW